MNVLPYLYVAVFHEKNLSDYGSPLIFVEKGKNPYNSDSCLLFDKNMEELIPIIEYILQLPRGDIDLIDLNEQALNYCIESPHFILLLPDSLRLIDSSRWKAVIDKATGIFLCDSVEPFKININPLLGVHYSSDIGCDLLGNQWKIAFENLNDSPFEKLNYNPIFFKNNYLKCLQFMFLARLLQEDTIILSDLYRATMDKTDQLCNKYLYYLIIKQRALSSLNKDFFQITVIQLKTMRLILLKRIWIHV